MKRSQVDEENCGHWEFEVQHPGDMASDQSPSPRSFGMTTRRLRFLRSSRDLTSGMTLVEAASAVDETISPVQRARTDFSSALATIEQGVSRRTSVGADEKLSGSLDRDGGVMSADHGVLETTEISMVVVHEDEVPGSSQRVADDLRQEFDPSPLEGTPSTGAGKPHPDHGDGDRGKENRDPLNHPIAAHRSPLPEWFPRRPLQDITNILNGGLDDEIPQPKKKRNKKVGTTVAPTLILLDSPVENSQTITRSKALSCATSKPAYNLRKNFR